MDTTLSTAWLIINVHLVSVFWHCISVFANFSYGIALLGTPQCPPLYNLDNLWSMSSVLHRVIKLPPVKWVRMSLEESLINMVSSLNNYTVFKTHWNWGYTCKICKIWNIELYGWFFRLVEGCPGVNCYTLFPNEPYISTSYWTIVLKVKFVTATKGLHISFTSSLTKIQWN